MSLFDIFRKKQIEHQEAQETIVYIHGAGATPVSFTFIKSHLSEYNDYDVTYSTTVPLSDTVERVKAELELEFGDRPIRIVSHSLGGNIAALLNMEMANIEKVVTISTPFAGSKMLYFASILYPTTQLFKDAKHTASLMRKTKNVALSNGLCIISTAGYNPVVGLEPNDGVVTIRSQKAVQPDVFTSFNLNHTEILLSKAVVDEIRTFIE